MQVQLKKEKKRNQLLKSAYWLFTNKGFHKTTIQNIAHRAGLGKGTFYLYFKDKEEIRDTLIIMKSSKLLKQAIEEVSSVSESDDFVERMIDVADYLIDYLSYNQDLLKFVSKSLSWGLFINSKNYVSKSKDIIDLDGFIRQLIEEHQVKLDNPELTIFTIIELISATCYSTIINEEPTTIDEYKPFLFDSIRLIAAKHLVTD